MSFLGTSLIAKIAGDSPAEKAFKPWWDNAQNFMVYGLVMLGKSLILFPTPLPLPSLFRGPCPEIDLIEEGGGSRDHSYKYDMLKITSLKC